LRRGIEGLEVALVAIAPGRLAVGIGGLPIGTGGGGLVVGIDRRAIGPARLSAIAPRCLGLSQGVENPIVDGDRAVGCRDLLGKSCGRPGEASEACKTEQAR